MDQNTYIEQAAAHFRALLTEQLNRQARMSQGSPAKDFSRMERIVIGLIPGDGIGPILMAQARRVLEKLLAAELAVGRVELRDIEGLTIENRTAQGKAIPDEVLASIKDCDVLLKGPTETPKGGTLESANVAMRRELDLFANVRPVSVPKLGIDWTFFRENTEGEYALGSRGIEVPGMLSMDFKVTTDAGTRRIAKAAFDFARANGKTNVAIVTKANIMKKTDGMFTRICHEVAADYPEITGRGLVHRHYDRQFGEPGDPQQVSGVRPAQSIRRHHHRRGRPDSGRRRHGGQRQHRQSICYVRGRPRHCPPAHRRW